MKPYSDKSGFTFIELLTVVTIIGILAAIAVPNFLHAQIRSRVSAVQAELATLSLVMEAYYEDNNSYPPNAMDRNLSPAVNRGLLALTTPVPYFSQLPMDPFRPDPRSAPYLSYVTGSQGPVDRKPFGQNGWFRYILASYGPDKAATSDFWDDYKLDTEAKASLIVEYNPTNGITSSGDIILLGP